MSNVEDYEKVESPKPRLKQSICFSIFLFIIVILWFAHYNFFLLVYPNTLEATPHQSIYLKEFGQNLFERIQQERPRRRRLFSLFDFFSPDKESSSSADSSNHWSYVLSHGSLNSFPTYDEATKLLDSFIAQYPDRIAKFPVGHSFQNRVLWGYRLGGRKVEAEKHEEIYNIEAHQCLASESITKKFNLTEYRSTVLEDNVNVTPKTLVTALHHAR